MTAESLLGDLGGFASFKHDASELKEELKEYQQDQFDGWSRDMLSAIDDPLQSIRYYIVCLFNCLYLHVCMLVLGL